MPINTSTNDYACAALLRYFVNQFAAEPPIPDRTGALPIAIQLPNANVLVMVASGGTPPSGAQLKQFSVEYARDVLFVKPGPNLAVPVLVDAVFATPAGPLLLADMTACRFSAELLWLVPPESAIRVSLGKEGMRLMPRARWWAGVDCKAGQALAHSEMASIYRAQAGC